MAPSTHVIAVASPLHQEAAARRLPFPLQIACILLLALLVSGLYPSGYVGGGGDDARYLQAIRCAAEQGYCVPRHHWGARLTLVMPAGLFAGLLGESRTVLAIAPMLYAAGALTLFTLIVRKLAGRNAALAAGCALVATPIFADRMQRLNVDIPELFFLLAGLWLLMLGAERNRQGLVVAAGAAFGLAVLTRTSAIASAPIVAVGLLLFTAAPQRRIALLATGGAGLLACEALLHWVGGGDPLLSWKLAYAHTSIPSTALPAGLDLSRSPLLNADYIANWHRSMGIGVHWLLDGALNFAANPLVRLTLLFAALSGLITIVRNNSAGRLPWLGLSLRARFLLGAAVAYFCLLTFVLAVHPTPRMFLPMVALAAFVIGSQARDPSREARFALAASLSIMLFYTSVQGLQKVGLEPYEAEAARWARAGGEQLQVDRTAAKVFALVPAVAALPVWKGATDPPVLHISGQCGGAGERRVLRRFVHRPGLPELGLIGRKLGLGRRGPVMCILGPEIRA